MRLRAVVMKDSYDKSRKCLIESLKILEKKFPKGHPKIALICKNLAGLDKTQNCYDQAEFYLLKALQIYQQFLPKIHPDIVYTLNDLAVLYQDQGHYDKALKYAAMSVDVESQFLYRNFVLINDIKIKAYQKKFRFSYFYLLSLVSRYLCDDCDAVKVSLNAVFKRKALYLSGQIAFSAAVSNSSDSYLQEKLKRLKQLAQERSILLDKPNIQEFREKVSELDSQYDRLYAELAQQFPSLQSLKQPSDYRIISKELPSDSCLIEYVQLQLPASTSRILAFVLNPSQSEPSPLLSLSEFN